MTAKDMVTFAGDRMRIPFTRFGPDEYALFLKTKRLPEWQIDFDSEAFTYTIDAPARFADLIGAARPSAPAVDLPLADFLFDDQRELVSVVLEAKRFTVWSGCGNGKTLIGLEVGRHVVRRTGGRYLIVTRNEIVNKWLDQARQFYGDSLPLLRLGSRADMRAWMAGGPPALAVTNYEKWNPDGLDDQVVNECRHLAGICLDEASRLRGGGGKQKWAIIKSSKGVEYKLSLTATPAPNDVIEFASQAAFLEKMRSDGEIIWTYFTRDPKSHRWTVRRHARAAFFEFMSSWSIYVNDPKRYGWRAGVPDVPKPAYHVVEIEPTPEQREYRALLTADAKTGQMALFPEDTNAIQRGKLSQLAKGFRYRKPKAGESGRQVERLKSRKPAVVADLVRKEVDAGAQVLVWTVFDAESEILARRLAKAGVKGFELLTGKTGEAERVDILDRFRRGETRVVVSRATILGYGMNLQFCRAMVFSGWTDSFEDLFQAVRRAVRHGQAESVRVYFPVIRELEGDTFDNIQRKEREFKWSIEEMEANYLKARERLRGARS